MSQCLCEDARSMKTEDKNGVLEFGSDGEGNVMRVACCVPRVKPLGVNCKFRGGTRPK